MTVCNYWTKLEQAERFADAEYEMGGKNFDRPFYQITEEPCNACEACRQSNQIDQEVNR